MNTTPAKPQSWFATTSWTAVMSAARSDTASRAALEHLCQSYWLPLYSYVRRRGNSPDDAQDLTQEFFATLLRDNRLARADQSRGRFRSFLLTSLRNFLSDEWDKSRALKRGGGATHISMSVDDGERTYTLEPVDTVTPEQIFERRWALTLLDNVLHRLKGEYAASGRAHLFNALGSCLTGDRDAQPYAAIAGNLSMTESAIKAAAHRLRTRYRELLRCEIAATVDTPEQVDEELGYLLQVFSR